MKKEFNTTVNLLYIAQLVTMICAISSAVYWWRFGDYKIILISVFLLYMSMTFHGLKIHLGRLITNDFETQTKKSLKLWTGMNRRQRRKMEPKIRKELRK